MIPEAGWQTVAEWMAAIEICRAENQWPAIDA
jgi:hypothetical protein